MLIALARIAHVIQRQQHLRGVVHVRVKLIIELERPAARNHILHALGPIALVPHFLGQQPVHRLQQPRIVLRNSRLAQCVDRLRGVPHRRHARLHPEGRRRIIQLSIRIVDAQLLELVHRANELRIVLRVSQAGQRNNRIQHGRIDRAKPVGHLEARQQPLLCLLQRHLAQRPDVNALKPVRNPIHHKKEVPPTDRLSAIPPQVQVGVLASTHKEFVDSLLRR